MEPGCPIRDLAVADFVAGAIVATDYLKSLNFIETNKKWMMDMWLVFTIFSLFLLAEDFVQFEMPIGKLAWSLEMVI